MRFDWEFERIAAGIGILALMMLGFASGCRRQKIVPAEELTEPAAETTPASVAEPPAEEEPEQVHFLDPLLGDRWLGHADDGALISVEFFVSGDGGRALARTNIVHAFGGAPNVSSSFTATADLGVITWDEGKSSGAYDPANKSVTAKITSNARVHQVTLQQVNRKTHPELGSFRMSIPQDEATKAKHQKFAAAIETGKRWWKSIDDWGKLVTPQDLVANPNNIALIRPAGKVPPKIPALEPGGHFNLPIECLLPPGTVLSEVDSTVGIVSELHHSGDVQATWILTRLNPGAIVQVLESHWIARPGDPVPTGPATMYIYLAKSIAKGEPGNKVTELNKPVSNLLRIELEIGTPEKGAPTAAPDVPE